MTFVPPERFNISEYFLGDRIAEGYAGRRAILTDDGELTYGEVDALANRFGNVLIAEGMRPEERVIVALPDGPEYVGALFGILRAGGVVVMVNPELNAEQIVYFYEYTRASTALVPAGGAAGFHAAVEQARHAPEILEVGGADFEKALRAADDELEPFPSHRDDAAIWLFSGGTTGQPKAVVQPHRSFANTTELYGKGTLGMGPDDVTLSVPKLFFGYATGSNLFFPFSVGAATVLFPERCTPEALFREIATHRPTVLINVPTMVGKMVAAPDAAGQDLACLRLSTSAGEALPVELHRRWDELWGVPLLDGLGTAEMWHIFISNRPDDVRPGTLGRVVDGFEVRVCDEEGAELAAGEVGYLWVKGDSRAIGYWQQMDKTVAAFRGEWYVSGDMVQMDADGYVTYGGRADDMLKVSGKWMSPKELENCLLEHEAVKEVAVVGVTTPEGLVKPKAFVVLADGVVEKSANGETAGAEPASSSREDRDVEPAAGSAEPGRHRGTVRGSDALAAELQEWTKQRLEPYKYPRAVVFLDDLPRTHLGKVDRGRLAAG